MRERPEIALAIGLAVRPLRSNVTAALAAALDSMTVFTRMLKRR
jgi:hypothetical protein